ncbi:MAG: hypothetical protein H7Y86_09090 [Rhizobacter sp.]|nr:hypothetical protein [Ferruginibacter sp.]
MKSNYQWIFFAAIILVILSCKSSKSVIKNVDNNCIEKKDVELFTEDYNIKKSEINKIEITSSLIIDSLCNGLYIIEYKFKDKTGLSIPVIKSNGEIIKYKDNDKEANIANLELFKQKFNDIITLADYERIKKTFLIGVLRTGTI